MALHRLTSITMGVPNVAGTAAYYAEFGLSPDGDGWFTTLRRRPRSCGSSTPPPGGSSSLHVGVDDADDLARAAANLARLGHRRSSCEPDRISAAETATGARPRWRSPPRREQTAVPATRYNGPGRLDRPDSAAPGVLRDRTGACPASSATPCSAPPTTRSPGAFFVDGLGFKVSDHIKDAGAFMRCSTDHHNVLVLAAPVSFLHHTSWQVDDIDEVGRGAFAMLEGRPERHVWGLGRHYAGSNFFWYLKDPAGNFSRVLLRHGLHRR